MGVAEDRDPVRAHGGRQPGALAHAGDALVRQAVHEVEADAGDSCAAQDGHRPVDEIGRLRPVDRLLDGGVEVLDAERDAVDP